MPLYGKKMEKELERKFNYDFRGSHICRIPDEEKGEINKNAVSFNYGKLKEYMIFIKKMVMLWFILQLKVCLETRPTCIFKKFNFVY